MPTYDPDQPVVTQQADTPQQETTRTLKNQLSALNEQRSNFANAFSALAKITNHMLGQITGTDADKAVIADMKRVLDTAISLGPETFAAFVNTTMIDAVAAQAAAETEQAAAPETNSEAPVDNAGKTADNADSSADAEKLSLPGNVPASTTGGTVTTATAGK